MIDKNIIRLASNTKYYGLDGIYTHKSSFKNSKCGDLIKIEVNIYSNKIKSLRYETESCVFCQASASVLSNRIIGSNIKSLKKNFLYLKKITSRGGYKLPKNLKFFNVLFKKKYANRLDCIMLPFNALLKAFKIQS